jgi:hypothetical protein
MTLFDTLDRMRYQIGLALNNTGSAWSGSNPLTSSPTSNADAYHYHSSPMLISSFYSQSPSGTTLQNSAPAGGVMDNASIWAGTTGTTGYANVAIVPITRPSAGYTSVLARYAYTQSNGARPAFLMLSLIKRTTGVEIGTQYSTVVTSNFSGSVLTNSYVLDALGVDITPVPVGFIKHSPAYFITVGISDSETVGFNFLELWMMSTTGSSIYA